MRVRWTPVEDGFAGLLAFLFILATLLLASAARCFLRLLNYTPLLTGSYISLCYTTVPMHALLTCAHGGMRLYLQTHHQGYTNGWYDTARYMSVLMRCYWSNTTFTWPDRAREADDAQTNAAPRNPQPGYTNRYDSTRHGPAN